MLHQIVQSHPELAAKIVIGTACFREREEDDVDALALLDQLSAFRDVNGVRLSGEVNANCEFFKRCREMGILYILFKMGQDKVSVEGLLDFFFGPTREGLENVERGVGDIEFIDEELPRRMLEVRHYGPNVDKDKG